MIVSSWSIAHAWSVFISRRRLSESWRCGQVVRVVPQVRAFFALTWVFATRRNPMVKQVVAALILRGDEILCCQRTEYQALPLKWEFPGGKIEPGEDAPQALRRELDEELGVQAEIGSKVAQVEHHYHNGNSVELHFFAVERYAGEL